MIIRNKNYNIKYIIWKYKYFENCWQIFSRLLDFKFLKYMSTSETEEVLALIRYLIISKLIMILLKRW